MYGSDVEALDAAEGALRELTGLLDVDALTAAGANDRLERLARCQRLVQAAMSRVARRVRDSNAHTRNGDRDAAATCAKALGVERGEASRLMNLTDKTQGLSQVNEALNDGALSLREAELIAGAASLDPTAEEELLLAVGQGLQVLKDKCLEVRNNAESDAARAARLRKQRHLSMWTDDDGMLAGRFRFTPEVGGQVKAVLDAAVQRTFRQRRAGGEQEPLAAYAADALAALVLAEQGDATKQGAAAKQGVKATVHVVVDASALQRGNTVDGERCEIPGVGPVSVAWVREILSDAFLTLVITKGKDLATVTHVGRHIPAELRTALVVAGRECDEEGCDHRGYLEIDHDVEFSRGGPTAWWNLRWKCFLHHLEKTRAFNTKHKPPPPDRRE